MTKVVMRTQPHKPGGHGRIGRYHFLRRVNITERTTSKGESDGQPPAAGSRTFKGAHVLSISLIPRFEYLVSCCFEGHSFQGQSTCLLYVVGGYPTTRMSVAT